jgi:beta-1,4-mannosyl-glycoprotein beta-1,4-N-acetylglucosaminyltransferase
MFFNENDLYEIRLNTHWNFVDKFIVVEAGQTHTGNEKTFNFDHERFKQYAEKIVYVKFENFQEEISKFPELLDETSIADRGPSMNTADWTRDHFQANYLFKVLQDQGAQDSDIVYISCLDEILKETAFYEALERFKEPGKDFQGLRPIFGFHYYLYVYKFNLLHKHWNEHVAGMITEFGNFKKILPATMRDRGMATHSHIQNAGWHFTFLDDTEGNKVLAKQKSWAHSRDKYPSEKLKYDNLTVEEALERMFKDYPHTIVPITLETHPQYVVDNIENLQKFIYKK